MDSCKDGLEQLDIHTMFKHEALDFTPWLAENLHMLGDAIGLKLEFVQREVPVGPYFLDIKAKAADGGAIVAIENQLEVTDMQPSRATAHLRHRMQGADRGMGRAGISATSMRRPCTGSTNGRTRASGSTASRSRSSSRLVATLRLGFARSCGPAAGAKRPLSNQERWTRSNCGTMSFSGH